LDIRENTRRYFPECQDLIRNADIDEHKISSHAKTLWLKQAYAMLNLFEADLGRTPVTLE
jgi:hypothetical protein